MLLLCGPSLRPQNLSVREGAYCNTFGNLENMAEHSANQGDKDRLRSMCCAEHGAARSGQLDKLAWLSDLSSARHWLAVAYLGAFAVDWQLSRPCGLASQHPARVGSQQLRGWGLLKLSFNSRALPI